MTVVLLTILYMCPPYISTPSHSDADVKALVEAAEWIVCPNRNRNEENDEGAYADLFAALTRFKED